MRKVASKITKKILLAVLAVCMCFTAVLPVSAAEPRAGEEVWNDSYGYVGGFTMSGHNLTPVKTVGKAGTLRLTVEYGRTDGYSNSPIHMRVQIREAGTQRVLAEFNDAVIGSDTYQEITFGNVPVSVGTRLQIDFTVTSEYNSPGVERQCYVKYWYHIS